MWAFAGFVSFFVLLGVAVALHAYIVGWVIVGVNGSILLGFSAVVVWKLCKGSEDAKSYLYRFSILSKKWQRWLLGESEHERGRHL